MSRAVPREHTDIQAMGLGAVKYNYCARCDKAYVRSRFERDSCMFCNADCMVVDVRRNAFYYFGYGVLVIGAVSAILPRFVEVSDRNPFLFFGIGLAIAGSIAVVVGTSKMAKTAAEEGRKRLSEE